MSKYKNVLKTIGPGLLFASSSIGTSHLVLSTRAGAHHGMIFLWIIFAALLFKYPFFEFGPRYANATGKSIVRGYRDQGKLAVILFFLVIFISMFAVTGALSAVSGGLISTILDTSDVSMPVIVGALMLLTGVILMVGRYRALDRLIKIISVLLLLSALVAFIAVLLKGRIEPAPGFVPNNNLFEGAGLILLVSLVGWMPSGLEASAMNSIWVVEKIRESKYRPTMREGMFDFNFGYLFTVVLAVMFLVVGAFTVYGSGELLEGSSTDFSRRLLEIFTHHLGSWAYPVMAMAAFVTIYGTLITAWDAFARSCAYSLRSLRFEDEESSAEQVAYAGKAYNIIMPLIGIGGFILFSYYTGGMIAMLELATIISFLVAPIIAYLNLKAITGDRMPDQQKPSARMLVLAYVGLVVMVVFAGYYVWHLIQHGVGH